MVELEARLASVVELRHGFEKSAGSATSELLVSVERDLERLLKIERAKPMTEGGIHPGKFNAETRDKILEGVRAGHWLEHAASAAGVSRHNVYMWRKRGEADIAAGQEDTAYAQFSRDITAAYDSQTMAMYEQAVVLAMAGDARSLIALLERRNPEIFAPRQKIEIDLRRETNYLLESVQRVCGSLPASTTPPEVYDAIIADLATGGRATVASL